MSPILKKILGVALDITRETASTLVPGAGIAISGVTKLFDKDDTNNAGAISEIEDGIITAVQNLKPSEISNAVLLAEGIKELKDGFDKVKRGLKH